MERQNPTIPMNGDLEAPIKNRQGYLLLVYKEYIEPLSGPDFKLRFGIRQTKGKFSQSENTTNELNIDETVTYWMTCPWSRLRPLKNCD